MNHCGITFLCVTRPHDHVLEDVPLPSWRCFLISLRFGVTSSLSFIKEWIIFEKSEINGIRAAVIVFLHTISSFLQVFFSERRIRIKACTTKDRQSWVIRREGFSSKQEIHFKKSRARETISEIGCTAVRAASAHKHYGTYIWSKRGPFFLSATPGYRYITIRQYKNKRAFLKGSTHNNIAFISAILYDMVSGHDRWCPSEPRDKGFKFIGLDMSSPRSQGNEKKLSKIWRTFFSIKKSVKLSINVKSYITPYFEATGGWRTPLYSNVL